MKVITKQCVSDKNKSLEHTLAERRALVAIRDLSFVVTLKYAFQTPTKLHLVMNYVSGGELFTHLYKQDTLSEHFVQFYAAELILALESLHSVSLNCRFFCIQNLYFLFQYIYICVCVFINLF